jgi:hypothetical protein
VDVFGDADVDAFLTHDVIPSYLSYKYLGIGVMM